MSSSKVLLGVIAGVAIGAALGVLFAPDKGSVTRKKVVKKSKDYVDGLGDKFNDFVDTLTEQFEAVQEEAVRIVEDAKAKADNIEAEVASKIKKTHS